MSMEHNGTGALLFFSTHLTCTSIEIQRSTTRGGRGEEETSRGCYKGWWWLVDVRVCVVAIVRSARGIPCLDKLPQRPTRVWQREGLLGTGHQMLKPGRKFFGGSFSLEPRDDDGGDLQIDLLSLFYLFYSSLQQHQPQGLQQAP